MFLPIKHCSVAVITEMIGYIRIFNALNAEYFPVISQFTLRDDTQLVANQNYTFIYLFIQWMAKKMC